MQQTFTQEQVKKMIAALNFIATHAHFGEKAPTIQFMVQARNHWSTLEQTIKTMEDHILEYQELRKLRDGNSETTGRTEQTSDTNDN